MKVETPFAPISETNQSHIVSGLDFKPRQRPYPEFLRLPGTLCPLTGLSRSKINELILPSRLNGFKPPVRSISLRNRGQIKGVRLIVVDSLLVYLWNLEVKPEVSANPQLACRNYSKPAPVQGVC